MRPYLFAIRAILSLVFTVPVAFADAAVTHDRALYPTRFDQLQVDELIQGGVSPEAALKFPEKFYSTEIVNITKHGLSTEEVRKYPLRFSGGEVERLVEQKIPLATILSYSSKFSGYAIIHLHLAGIEGREANRLLKAYRKEFKKLKIDDIDYLLVSKIPPEEAKRYPARFGGEGISLLIQNQITPKQIKPYRRRFRADGIVHLVNENISAKTANAYPAIFDGYAIVQLQKAGISAKTAARYRLPADLDKSFFYGYIIAEERRRQ